MWASLNCHMILHYHLNMCENLELNGIANENLNDQNQKQRT